MLPQSERIALYECHEFTIELEYNSEYVIWHTVVKTFNKTVLRKGLDVLDNVGRFLSLHYDYLWTVCPPERKDLIRLAQLGGFTFFSISEGYNVYRKPLKGEGLCPQ